MSDATKTKKLQTRHADDAIRMAERLPGILGQLVSLRVGLGCHPHDAGAAAAVVGRSTVIANRLYDHAINLLVTAVDSEEVSAEDIPDLLIVGWMRRDDDEPASTLLGEFAGMASRPFREPIRDDGPGSHDGLAPDAVPETIDLTQPANA